MKNAHLHRLFAYDLWANNRMVEALSALIPLNASDPPANLLSHIIAAQEVWVAHIQDGFYAGPSVWAEIHPEAWPERLRTLNATWLHLLDTRAEDIDARITYQNSRGKVLASTLHEILLHVIIHGQHHRAQIATHLRQKGYAPPSTDFIYFTLYA